MSISKPSPSPCTSDKDPTSAKKPLLPSPFSAEELPSNDNNQVNDEEEASPSPTQDPQPPRPPFTPFFTLLEDHSTGTTHHPTIHYQFSSDSTDLLTAACLRSLPSQTLTSSSSLQNNPTSTSKPNSSSSPSENITNSNDEDEDEQEEENGGLPPSKPGIQDRYLLLDMSPNGKEIVSAHSLSPEWAILSTEISKAPTFASSPSATNTGAEGDKGLMLRIEGTEIISDEGVGADKISEGDMETLLGTFEKRMGDLRKVIEGGGIDGCNGREEGEG